MATPPENVFAPPKSVVADRGMESQGQKASRGERLGAKFIDGLLYYVSLWPLMGWVSVNYLARFNARAVSTLGYFADWHAWMAGGVAMAAVIALIDARLVQRNGQTIGKKLFNIRIVRSDGSPVTLSRVFFLRFLISRALAWVPFVGGLYVLTDTLFIFGDRRRCVHDYIADTIVVRA